jgi:Ribbon-helix-helix protein, copG family
MVTIKQRRRGPPAVVDADGTLAIEVPLKLVAAVDAWRKQVGVTRSEAIRRLVELGLRKKSEQKPSAEDRMARGEKAAKASDMAGRTIDGLVDNASSTEEQQVQRKRRLIKGPAEFRDMRDRAIRHRDRR